ncbi:MAG: hypothetical protein QOE53_1512 [Pseudonocardiales bacterium]|nr:hypothetical protein [Pseudonocardiales bacterium]
MAEVTTAAPLGLWSAPRSMSTAFFRMMAERDEFCLIHEPFYACANDQPVEVAGRELRGADQVISFMRRSAQPVFFKETTEYQHANLFARHPELLEMTHTFIIRDPRRVIESHYALNPEVPCDEIGFEYLAEIFDLVRRETGGIPVVVDADQLVRDPAGMVSAYCRRVGLAERPDALSWTPAERPEWAATNRWHQDAAASTTFQPVERSYPVTVENNERLAGYLEYHLPFYQQLRSFSLTTTGSQP